eukprot:scaffold74634_cov52-Attheya_sp.AAC.2
MSNRSNYTWPNTERQFVATSQTRCPLVAHLYQTWNGLLPQQRLPEQESAYPPQRGFHEN